MKDKDELKEFAEEFFSGIFEWIPATIGVFLEFFSEILSGLEL